MDKWKKKKTRLKNSTGSAPQTFGDGDISKTLSNIYFWGSETVLLYRTYLNIYLYIKHRGCSLPLSVGGLYCWCSPGTQPMGKEDPPAGFLSTWTQRAGRLKRIIGYFSTMRMTIYLLDGCSADYVIIENHLHPLLALEKIPGECSWLDYRKHTEDHGKQWPKSWIDWGGGRREAGHQFIFWQNKELAWVELSVYGLVLYSVCCYFLIVVKSHDTVSVQLIR